MEKILVRRKRKLRKKDHFKVEMKKIDEILAIKNDQQFTRKVFQVMQIKLIQFDFRPRHYFCGFCFKAKQ